MAGSAVDTMVWSTIARNIGIMIDGKTVKKSARLLFAGSGAGVSGASGSSATAFPSASVCAAPPGGLADRTIEKTPCSVHAPAKPQGEVTLTSMDIPR
jgi:hypothetical protein